VLFNLAVFRFFVPLFCSFFALFFNPAVFRFFLVVVSPAIATTKLISFFFHRAKIQQNIDHDNGHLSSGTDHRASNDGDRVGTDIEKTDKA
jgi:hypothetical protein